MGYSTSSGLRPLLISFIAVLAASLSSVPAHAIQLQSWVATAQILSGNTTLTESPAPPAPSGPEDSTGFLEANGSELVPVAPIDAGASAAYGLSTGTMGAASGFDATSNFPIDNRIFSPGSGSSATYFDDLTVTSSTLPAGTPVDVRFVFYLGFTAGVASTLDDATTSAQISSVAAGVQGLSAGDNRYLDLLDAGTFIQNGLFAAPHQAEYVVSTTVGAPFSFTAKVQTASGGRVRPTGSLGNEINHSATGWSSVGVSFGGEVISANAELVSGLLAGPFPTPAQASAANAEAAVPANPFAVPEPAATSMLASGGLALMALARVRARARTGKHPNRPNDSESSA